MRTRIAGGLFVLPDKPAKTGLKPYNKKESKSGPPMPVRFCFISIPSCQSGTAALRSPTDFALSGARRPPLFAPRSSQTLVPPFRGAKSSHSRRRISPLHALGGLLSLLPAPRKPLCLRLGEQNLHIPAAGFRPSARPAGRTYLSPGLNVVGMRSPGRIPYRLAEPPPACTPTW